MSKTTNTVRFFDGTEWATYKEGGKKHRAAELRRAEFDAAKVVRQEQNVATAAFLRKHSIVPSGRAWAEVKQGLIDANATASDLPTMLSEKNLDRLRKLNAKDGLVFKVRTEKAAKPEAEVAEASTKAKGKKARRKARSEAARKGWETRRRNAALAAEAEVTPEVTVAKAEGKKPKGAKKRFYASLSKGGFEREEIDGLWTKYKAARA